MDLASRAMLLREGGFIPAPLAISYHPEAADLFNPFLVLTTAAITGPSYPAAGVDFTVLQQGVPQVCD